MNHIDRYMCVDIIFGQTCLFAMNEKKRGDLIQLYDKVDCLISSMTVLLLVRPQENAFFHFLWLELK